MFAGNFAPRSWALCDGQLLSISQNNALFALLGTIYGGDGRITFGLPDLRGRIPIHAGTGPALSPRRLGDKGGQENVTVTADQLPSHTHQWVGTNDAAQNTSPTGTGVASPTPNIYEGNPDVAMDSNMVGDTGGSGSHSNIMPFLGINFIIALSGIFPSRT